MFVPSLSLVKRSFLFLKWLQKGVFRTAASSMLHATTVPPSSQLM